MTKKVSLILILLALFAVPVFASNVYTTSEEYTKTTSYTFNASSSNESTATTSVVSSLPEAQLGLTNILNILLIVIGILLILLAIAILIRLKN